LSLRTVCRWGCGGGSRFAIALGHHPDLLVLDEPTSGVDPLQRARLWETIRATAEQGAGALVTAHHLAEAEQCDRRR
jgi:ABC-2 type transport system ATP-binding protein/ribosome-dependent ATPase